jgi:hypothetical protein
VRRHVKAKQLRTMLRTIEPSLEPPDDDGAEVVGRFGVEIEVVFEGDNRVVEFVCGLGTWYGVVCAPKISPQKFFHGS